MRRADEMRLTNHNGIVRILIESTLFFNSVNKVHSKNWTVGKIMIGLRLWTCNENAKILV